MQKQTNHLITYVSAAVLLLSTPFSVFGAAFQSSAPVSDVAPGAQKVLVMDFELPEITIDTRVAGENIGIVPNPHIDLQPGDQLFDLKPEHKVYRDTKMNPTKMWIDKDASGRYTGAHEAWTKAVSTIPGIINGDIDLPLAAGGGVPDYRLSGSDINRNEGDQYFRDNGNITNYYDPGDSQLSPGEFIMRGESSRKAALYLYKTSNEAGDWPVCATSYAIGDYIKIPDRGNPTLGKKIIGITSLKSQDGNFCITRLELDSSAPYFYKSSDEITVSTYEAGRDARLEVSDSNGGAPKASTTMLTLTTGSARGMRVGDLFDVKDTAGSFIRYKITGIEAHSGQAITYLSVVRGAAGVDLAQDSEYTITNYYIMVQLANFNTGPKHLTIPLMSRGQIKYNDLNGDGSYDEGEAIYADLNGDNAVSHNDDRLSAIEAEEVLLGIPQDGQAGFLTKTVPGDFGGTWRRQSYSLGTLVPAIIKWVVPGDDIVLDKNNDGYFQADVINRLTVRNNGTADKTNFERIEAWSETNGTPGLQTDDMSLGELGNVEAKKWKGAAMNMVISGTPRLYITADIVSTAIDGATLQFSVPVGGIELASGSVPDSNITNEFIQTIKESAALPPVSPTISAAHSEILANPTELPGDNIRTTEITVIVRDTNGNTASGRTVSLRKVRAVVAGIGDLAASGVTDASGRAVFLQSSDEADTFLYSAYVGNTLLGSAQITFTETAAAPAGDGGAKAVTPPEEIQSFTQCTGITPANCDQGLITRLLGRIILAVQKNGEAFYMYPQDRKGYYLGRPHQAFNIMRFLGVGMSNNDVAKLFDNFSTPNPGDLAVFETKDRGLLNRVAGKIILQVEENGEAYYINPEDKNGYYLGRPKDAFRIMRERGLGINNINLAKLELVSAPETR